MELPTVVTPPPGPRSLEILTRASKLSHRRLGPGQAVPFVLDRKDGWFLHDVDGNSFVDMVTGWGSTVLGANHPDVAAAVVDGLGRYSLENTDYVFAEPLLQLAERLIGISPPSLTRVTYEVSGT